MKKLFLYFNTIRYLKFIQVFYLIYFKLNKQKTYDVDYVKRSNWDMKWHALKSIKNAWDGSNTFTFLNKTSKISLIDDWNSDKFDKLWLYNIHYLDCINFQSERYNADDEKRLIIFWIKNNPPSLGNGWEPYCLSLRIVNLVKWCSREACNDNVILTSLASQSEALFHQIEYHIQANHLFANAKALIFAGCFFDGDIARKWFEKGFSILKQELEKQFLNDGAHFELSPMYHAIMMWDICDLLHLSNISFNRELNPIVNKLITVLRNGLDWLSKMIHPDGEVSFFNDSSIGIGPKYSELTQYANKLGFKLNKKEINYFKVLDDSGYFTYQWDESSKLIFDLADVKATYQPGHTHADTFSLELSLFDKRVLVNSGTSLYGTSLERFRQRSTTAHNTVCINNSSSSQVWSGFRVAKRAKVSYLKISHNNRETTISATHSGYNRFLRKTNHYRACVCTPNELRILDKVIGPFCSAKAYFYLHPEIQIKKQSEFDVTLLIGDNKEVEVVFSNYFNIISSTWHPEFGVSIKNECLVVDVSQNGILETRISW